MSAWEIILSIVTGALVIVTLAPLWTEEVWWVRVWEFPRLQLGFLALASMVAGAFLLDLSAPTGWIILAAATAVFLWQTLWVLPFLPVWRRNVASATVHEPDDCIRIINANVLMPNRGAPALLRVVEEFDPDILVALETDDWWDEQLRPLEKRYPYTRKCPLPNLYGMHVFSRLRLENAEIKFLIEDGVPSVHGDVVLHSGRKVRVHFLHPAPPGPTENEESLERDAELLLVGREVAEDDWPVIVSGDLNDVAWSRTTRRFRRISHLLDPRIGRGMFNSFHARHWYLRWSLDHFFHSDHFTLREIRRLPPIGSDHFPVLLELQLQPEKADEQETPSADAEEQEETSETINEGRQASAEEKNS